MVRSAVLTCVLGVAACCLAVIIQPSISYASDRCPCFPGGVTQLELEIGPPATTNFSRCDNILQAYDLKPTDVRSAGIYASDTSLIAWAEITGDPRTNTGNDLVCKYKDKTYEVHRKGGEPINQIVNYRSIELCMQDIVTYCREYCTDNPNANCE